jgi:hypothetical protein
LVAVVIAACVPGAEPTTTTPSTTAPFGSSTTTTLEPLVECPPIPYAVSELPTRVTGEAADLESIELDEFTAIGGTRSVFWVNAEGELAIALIRGPSPRSIGPENAGRWMWPEPREW